MVRKGTVGQAPPSLITPAFVSVTLASLCYFTAMGAVLPVLPRYIEGTLGGTPTQVGFGVGAFAFSAVVARPFLGRLGDRVGRRYLIIGGGVVMAAGTMGMSSVESFAFVVAMRLVQGVGEAAQFVGAVTYVSDLAPDERRGEAMSYFSVAIYGGLAVGPLAGEALLAARGPRDVFVAAGLVSLVGVMVGLRAPSDRSHHIEAHRRRRADASPQVGWRSLVHPAGLRTGVVLGLGIMGLTGFVAFMPLHADALGFGGSRYLYLCYGSLILVIRIFGATLPDRLGYARVATVALLSVGGGLVVMGGWSAVPGLWVGTVVFSLGMSLMYPALQSLAVTGVAAEERGAVVGTFTMFFDLAQGVGGTMLGVVASVADYETAFVVAGVVAASGALALRLLEPGLAQQAATTSASVPSSTA